MIAADSLTDNREPHLEAQPHPLPPQMVTNHLCLADPCVGPASITDGLSLNFLDHPQYTDGPDSDEHDYLHAAGDGQQEADDAFRMASQEFGGEVYGRVQRSGSYTFLQYWLFYYLNGTVELSGGLGEHVGDWELVQVRLDQDGVPDGVTFGYHNHEGHCDLDGPMRTVINGSGYVVPVVYVAANSHASYPSPGRYDAFGTANDEARGDSPELPELDPTIETTFSGTSAANALPRWLRWPGRWGETATVDGESPPGPAQQVDRWDDPGAWTEGANDCQTPDGP